MSTTISLTLPDEVLRAAEAFAQRSGQDVANVLADAIEDSLDPLGISKDNERSLKDASDSDVIAACDSTMPSALDDRLTVLLDGQQDDQLSLDERNELRTLMRIYQEGLLKKSMGIAEAVKRGLRQAPQP